MKTIMKTLDTADPDIKKLVLAVIDNKDDKKKSVNFRYLTDNEKKALIEEINKNKK